MKITIENGEVKIQDDNGANVSGKGIVGIDIELRGGQRPKATLYYIDNISGDIHVELKDTEFVMKDKD